jgi:transposase-like protein
MIENLRRRLRKVTKTATIFPNETALAKLLYLAQHDITRRWTVPSPNRGTIIAQFTILFPDRVEIL